MYYLSLVDQYYQHESHEQSRLSVSVECGEKKNQKKKKKKKKGKENPKNKTIKEINMCILIFYL
jgi:hypothetical protein